MPFKNKILNLLKKQTGLKTINLETPPESFGDYSFPCFQLSKKLKKSPNEIALDLSKKIKADFLEKTETKGPYLNFFIKKEKLTELILKKIQKEKENYGSKKNNKKTYIVEYFHANTHKGVHIGHIRNISIGETLCRVLEKTGHKVIRVNYQGDIGPHVAKCLWGYINLKQKEPKTKKGIWLGKIYALANKRSIKNKKIEEEIRQINNKIYQRDKTILKIWKKTRQDCLKDFEDFYKDFGVKFSRLYFESEVEDLGKQIVMDLLKKGTVKKSEGAIIMDLEKYKLGIYVLLTKDNNALYHSKDLGLAELKQKEFKFDKSIHVTGAEQKLYFQQIFKTFEITHSKIAGKSLHLPYGLVMLPEGKMSSRTGTMILFEDLKDKMFKATEKEIKNRNKKLSKEEIAVRTKKIAYSAIKFSMLNKDNNKDLIFDWNTALSFEGETGPYIQYSYARIQSILKKAKIFPQINYKLLNNLLEFKLIKQLSLFPSIIQKASQDLKPNLIANYIFSLSKTFNEYYHAYNILREKQEIKNARLALISSIATIIKISLNLLGIEVLDQM